VNHFLSEGFGCGRFAHLAALPSHYFPLQLIHRLLMRPIPPPLLVDFCRLSHQPPVRDYDLVVRVLFRLSFSYRYPSPQHHSVESPPLGVFFQFVNTRDNFHTFGYRQRVSSPPNQIGRPELVLADVAIFRTHWYPKPLSLRKEFLLPTSVGVSTSLSFLSAGLVLSLSASVVRPPTIPFPYSCIANHDRFHALFRFRTSTASSLSQVRNFL